MSYGKISVNIHLSLCFAQPFTHALFLVLVWCVLVSVILLQTDPFILSTV